MAACAAVSLSISAATTTMPRGGMSAYEARRTAADSLHWTLITVDSQPIAKATIRTTKPDGTPATFTTGSDGRVTILMAPGSKAVIEAPGFRTGYVDKLEPGDEDGPPPPTATFHVRAAISGVVTDEEGHPVAGATVDVDTLIVRDPQFSSQRPPLARTTTDQQGHFTIAPRAFYVPSGHINASDPLTLFVSTASPRRMAVIPLPFDSLTRPKPTVKVTLGAFRPVRVTLADGTGLSPANGQLEVLPQDSAILRSDAWLPRLYLNVPMTAGANGQWSTTLLLPSHATYRVVVPTTSGRLASYDAFVVPPGRDTLALPTFALKSDAQRFAAGISGSLAPELQATTIDGKPVHLADYRGKVVVLDFWGFWCEPCVMKFPLLNRVANEYRDSNVVVLSLHDASVASAEDYHSHYAATVAKQPGLTPSPLIELLDRPLVSDTVNGKPVPVIGPASGQTVGAYGIQGFPTTMVIDPYGRYVGVAPNEVEAEIGPNGQPTGKPKYPEHDTKLEQLIHQARTVPAPKP